MSKTINFGLQRRVVSHMTTKSWRNIPHVTYLYEPDITEFYEEYRELAKNSDCCSRKLSFNTVMLRAIIEGLKASPDLNATISYNFKKGEGTLKTCDHINICMPWLLPDQSIITPVIQHAEKKTLDTLAECISELAKKIENTNVDELLYRAAFSDTVSELKKLNLGIFKRIIASTISVNRVKGLSGQAKKQYYTIPESSRLSADNLISGTVTISNIGSIYKEQKGCFGLLEIVPPQVFAIGLGAVQEKPGIFIDTDGSKQIGIRNVLPMCLVFDHRALDFCTLIPFLKIMDHIFSEKGIISSW